MPKLLDTNQFEEAPSISGAVMPAGGVPAPSVQQSAPVAGAGQTQSDAPQPQNVGGAPQPTLKPLQSAQLEELPSYANGLTAATPINKSPLGPLDHALLSLGNTKGNIDYLKKNFEDVTKTPTGDLAVKKDGTWFRVDPKHYGDPDAWDTTKKLAMNLFSTGASISPTLRALGAKPQFGALADTANLYASNAGNAISGAGMAIGGAAGAVAGTAIAPGPGTVGGEIAGASAGAAAASGIRTSLGRLAGTYEATPDEQLKDAGWDGLLAAGGATLAAGVRPTLPYLGKALSDISDTGTNYVKSVLAKMYGHATGAGDWAMRRALDDSEPIVSKVASTISELGSKVDPSEGADILARDQANKITMLAKQSKASLQGLWQKNQSDLIGSVGSDFKVNFGDMMSSLQNEMVQNGFGKMVSKDAAGAAGSVLPMAADFAPSVADDSIGKVFRPLTTAEIGQKLSAFAGGAVPEEQIPKILGENSINALKSIGDLTNEYSKLPALQGKVGAQKLMEFKRAFGESLGDLVGNDTPDTVKRLVYKLKDSFNETVGQPFADAGLGEKWVGMNANYAAKKDAVDLFNDAVNNGKADSLVKQLVSKSGSYRGLKDEAQSIADLVPGGHKHIQDILDSEAAKGFLPFVAKGSGGNSASQVARWAAGLAQQANPRVVLQQVDYMNKGIDFMRSLSPGSLKELLTSDASMTKFVKPLVDSYVGEDGQTQQLLNASGVIPPQGGK